uniref:Sensory/regulatory protein RpfC n=1 Tax=Magnetococcus massalia (strain MO-1) TaxID=451514 RepID=A0A1S7LKJ8_MAGMO|nr:putative histidine kinase Containing HAMP, HisKA, HATPase_c, 2 response regulator receiver domain and Hpt domain [Candidatus Magnetococcus massalia]
MKIRNKLFLAFTGMAMFVLLLSAIVITFNLEMQEQVDELSNSNIIELRSAHQVELSVQRIKSNLREILVEIYELATVSQHPHPSHTPEMAQLSNPQEDIAYGVRVVKKHTKSIEGVLVQWQKAIEVAMDSSEFEEELVRGLDEEDELEEIEELRHEVEEYVSLSKQFIARVQAIDWQNQQSVAELVKHARQFRILFESKIEPLSRELQDEVMEARHETSAEIYDVIGIIERDLVNTTLSSIILATLASITALLTGFYISRSIAKPVEKLESAAKQISLGDYSAQVTVESEDEIAQLASAFNTMAGNLSFIDGTLNTMNDLLVIMDPEGNVIRLNRPDLLKLKAHHLSTLHLETLLVRPDHARVLLDTVTINTSSIPAQELTLKCTDGEALITLCSFAMQRTQDGQLKYIIMVAKEIGAFRAARQELQQKEAELMAAQLANESKSEFLANMSHEIRTPMNAVTGLTELALQTNLTGKSRDYLVKINHASRSLIRVINDILDYSKIDAGKLELDYQNFLLRDLFDRISNLFSANADEKGLELIMVMDRECSYVLRGDAFRLEQILMNLVSNALKFTEQGEVEIGVEQSEASEQLVKLSLYVRDSGIGMSQEQVDKMFQSFSQADTSVTRKYGGTGLGLSISKRLAEMMGGTIRVESRLNQGSTFHLTVQLQRVMEEEREDDLRLPQALQQSRALVVDDCPATGSALSQMLTLFRFQAHSTTTLEQAEQQLQQAIDRQQPYSLLVIDSVMPGLEIGQTLDRLNSLVKQMDHGDGCKTLVLTGYGQHDAVKAWSKDREVAAFVSKPVTCSLFFDTIMDAFGLQTNKLFRPGHESIDHTAMISKKVAGKRVLVAEDNHINQQVARELLEQIGLIVDVVENGQLAIEALNSAQQPYDLLFMDLQMPKMDGYTATKKIRAMGGFGAIPIIAMTAHAMVSDREKCLVAGMNDHISKPIERKQLYLTVLRWLNPFEVATYSQEMLDAPVQSQQSLLLFDLPGIDMQDAMTRFGNNSKLYLSLLAELKRDYADVAQQIADALDPASGVDLDRAKYLTHSLKGFAGNLAARELADTAFALEISIQEHNGQMQQESLQRLTLSLEQTLSAVDSLLENMPAEVRDEKGEAVAADPAQLEALIRQLASELYGHNFQSQATFDKLAPLLERGDEKIAQLATEIADSIDTIEFKQAREALEALAQRLDIPLEEA